MLILGPAIKSNTMKSFRWDANANCMHCDENLSSYAGSAQIGCLIIGQLVSYQPWARWEFIGLFIKNIAHDGLLERPPLTLLKLLTLPTMLTLNSLLMQDPLKLAVSLSVTRFQIGHIIWLFIEGHFINLRSKPSSSVKIIFCPERTGGEFSWAEGFSSHCIDIIGKFDN